MGSAGVLMHRRDSVKPFLEAEWNQPSIFTVTYCGMPLSWLCSSVSAAADRNGVGPEMPTVGTASFAEPTDTAPIACLFMCGERLCRNLGRVSTYSGFCKHPFSCRLAQWLHVILAIKQFKVKCQETGRATISHHPIKCYNLLFSQNLICSF